MLKSRGLLPETLSGRRLSPGVSEGNDEVEHRRALSRVLGVGEVIALALELVALCGLPRCQRRLYAGALHHLQGARVDLGAEIDLAGARVDHLEEAIVESQRRRRRQRRRDPVDGPAHFPAVLRIRGARLGIDAGAQLGYLAGTRVLLYAGAPQDVRVAKAHLLAGGEAPPPFDRHLHEVLALDEELAREWELARARRRRLGHEERIDLVHSSFG